MNKEISNRKLRKVGRKVKSGLILIGKLLITLVCMAALVFVAIVSFFNPEYVSQIFGAIAKAVLPYVVAVLIVAVLVIAIIKYVLHRRELHEVMNDAICNHWDTKAAANHYKELANSRAKVIEGDNDVINGLKKKIADLQSIIKNLQLQRSTDQTTIFYLKEQNLALSREASEYKRLLQEKADFDIDEEIGSEPESATFDEYDSPEETTDDTSIGNNVPPDDLFKPNPICCN